MKPHIIFEHKKSVGVFHPTLSCNAKPTKPLVILHYQYIVPTPIFFAKQNIYFILVVLLKLIIYKIILYCEQVFKFINYVFIIIYEVYHRIINNISSNKFICMFCIFV